EQLSLKWRTVSQVPTLECVQPRERRQSSSSSKPRVISTSCGRLGVRGTCRHQRSVTASRIKSVPTSKTPAFCQISNFNLNSCSLGCRTWDRLEIPRGVSTRGRGRGLPTWGAAAKELSTRYWLHERLASRTRGDAGTSARA